MGGFHGRENLKDHRDLSEECIHTIANLVSPRKLVPRCRVVC